MGAHPTDCLRRGPFNSPKLCDTILCAAVIGEGMFRRIRIVSLLLLVLWVGVSSAQKSLPTSVEMLPQQVALPQLMRLSDGTPVKTNEQWKQRREEIKRMMLFYQYGSMPGAPDKVSAMDITKTEHKSGKGTEESLTLLIQTKDRPDLKLSLIHI